MYSKITVRVKLSFVKQRFAEWIDADVMRKQWQLGNIWASYGLREAEKLDVLSVKGSLTKGKLLKGMTGQTLSDATSNPRAVELNMRMACFFIT